MIRIALLFIIFTMSINAQEPCEDVPDYIVYNAHIYTMDTGKVYGTAMTIKDGKISKIGDDYVLSVFANGQVYRQKVLIH